MLAAPTRVRVGMPGEVGQGAVDLLAQHHPRKLVRQREGAERHALIGLVDQRGVEADGAADEKRRWLRAFQPRTHPLRERLAAGRGPSAHIERHHVGPVHDLPAHALALLAKHLCLTVLHSLRRYLIHPQIGHSGDALLVFGTRGIHGCTQSPDDDELDEAAHRDIVGARE